MLVIADLFKFYYPIQISNNEHVYYC